MFIKQHSVLDALGAAVIAIVLYYVVYVRFDAYLEAKKEKKWIIGDWVYAVGSVTGCCRVFYPVPVTYAETKTMENLVRRGWVFDKEEECEALCGKLNEAIKDVKP